MNVNFYKLFYNILTTSSAFSFLLLFLLNEFSESHIYIYALIISSIIYKLAYLYCYIDFPYIVDIITYIDYICIFNLLWSHNYKYFLDYGLYKYIYLIILIISFINYNAFHFCLIFLYFLTLSKLIMYDYIITLFYVLSGFLISHSYYSFNKHGWNIINSWNWHLSICLCFLCVKMSYKNI